MSEQEKKSSGGAGGSSVVLVEQPGSGRHKQPFRPTDLQDDAPELQHKRSRAPAVPSVAEELKDNANSETNERKESERAMSSEKQKHSIAKKLSSNTKRRGSSPESITLAQLEVTTKKGMVTPTPQPIPAQVSSVASAASDLAGQKSAERKEEDDSITDEIAELRTPEVVKKTSDWDNKPYNIQKKEVSWNDQEYLDKVELQDNKPDNIQKKEVSWNDQEYLDKVELQDNKPDNIQKKEVSWNDQEYVDKVELQKFARFVGDEGTRHQSVINITVSKKCLVNKTRSYIVHQEKEPTIEQVPQVKFFGSWKQKLSTMTEKIKDVLTS